MPDCVRVVVRVRSGCVPSTSIPRVAETVSFLESDGTTAAKRSERSHYRHHLRDEEDDNDGLSAILTSFENVPLQWPLKSQNQHGGRHRFRSDKQVVGQPAVCCGVHPPAAASPRTSPDRAGTLHASESVALLLDSSGIVLDTVSHSVGPFQAGTLPRIVSALFLRHLGARRSSGTASSPLRIHPQASLADLESELLLP